MGKVIEMPNRKVTENEHKKDNPILEEMVESFIAECCTPKITGDRVYRIEFIEHEDGFGRVTKIVEVNRETPLEDPGTMQIGSLKQEEHRWWLTGFLMGENADGSEGDFFYASFKDLPLGKAKELILSNDLAIAWL